MTKPKEDQELSRPFHCLPMNEHGRYAGAFAYESKDWVKRIEDDEREHLVKYQIALIPDCWILVNPAGIVAVIKKHSTVRYSISHEPFLGALTNLLCSATGYPIPKPGSETKYPLVDREGRIEAVINCSFSAEGTTYSFSIEEGTDSELKKIAGILKAKQEDPRGTYLRGSDAEEYLGELAQSSFLAMWTYLNPVYLPVKEELCDLLQVFDDVAVIWQVKGLKIQGNRLHNPREVEKNHAQLIKAKKRLLEPDSEISVYSHTWGKEKKKFPRIRKVYLVSALLGEETSHTVDNPPESGDEFIHQMDRKDVEYLFSALDTPSDLIRYFSEKETFYRKGPTEGTFMYIEGEEALLEHFLQCGTLEGIEKGDATHVCSSNYLDSPEFHSQKQKSPSWIWDSLILSSIPPQPSTDELCRRLVEVMRPTRIIRTGFSICILDYLKDRAHGKPADLIWMINPYLDCTYIFHESRGTPLENDSAIKSLRIGKQIPPKLRKTSQYILMVANRNRSEGTPTVRLFDVTGHVSVA